MDIVAEFMEHSIDDILRGHELVPIARVPQTETYLSASVHVEACLL